MNRTTLLLAVVLYCHYSSGDNTIAGQQFSGSPPGDQGMLLVQRIETIMAESSLASTIDFPPAFSREQRAIDRLVELADHHRTLDLRTLAINELSEAQARIHSLYGVHSLKQLYILDRLTKLYAESGQLTQVDRTERLRYALIERHYARNSRAMLSATYRLANWQSVRGNYMDAVFTLEHGLAIIENMDGESMSGELLRLKHLFESAADEAAMSMYANWDKTVAESR